MKIAAISDVHQQWLGLEIEPCDILISAGDYSYKGDPDVVFSFHSWLSRQPAKHIISVQGNHEVWVEKNFRDALDKVKAIDPKIHFLAVGAIEIEGIKIWCSAVQPEFYNWAWNMPRGKEIAEHWSLIPHDTQILVTHGPPYDILDRSILKRARLTDEPLGCKDLRSRIDSLDNLKLHIFGHIHGSSGEIDLNNVHFINAAICDEDYRPTNPVRYYEFKK